MNLAFKDIRKNPNQERQVPAEIKQFRRENNLRRLTRIELSAVLNKNSQTKKYKKYKQSDSLNAKAYLHSAAIEREQERAKIGAEAGMKNSAALVIRQPSYLTREDIGNYLI